MGVEAEEVELLAQLAVVPGARLLLALQVLVELLLGAEGGAVDALEHLVRLVAPEVGARGREQLDRADLLGRAHVGPAAQILEAAVAKDRDRRPFGDVAEALDLQALAHLAEHPRRLVAGDLDALERLLLLEDLAHLALDGLEVLRGERAREAEVVLELLGVVLAADVDLHLGPQALDRVGQHVLRAVADEVARVGVLDGDDPERAAGLERLAQVDRLAVQGGAHRGLGQAGTDRGGDVQRRGAAFDLADRSVGQAEADGLSTHGGSPREERELQWVVEAGMAGGAGRRERTRTADLYRVKVAL